MPNYKGRTPGTRRIVISVNGTPHERVIPGSKPDGDVYEAQWRIELEASSHDTRVVPQFSRLSVEKYSPFAEANLAKSTWRARKNILATLVEFFGQKKLTTFEPADIERYKAHRKKRIGAVSLNTELRTLMTVLHWAKKQGYRVAIPEVRYVKQAKGRVRIWNPEQVQTLLETARVWDPVLLPVLIFLVNTGCRKGEAIAAEWSWIDLKADMIRIPATEFWTPKNGSAREVPIGDAVRPLLSGRRRSDRWVFPNRDNDRFAYFPDTRFKELQNEAKLFGGIHTLRHVYASAFLQSTPDLFLLSEVLGHSHERITAIYSHLLPEHLSRARNAVNITLPTKAVADTG
jgi:integrase